MKRSRLLLTVRLAACAVAVPALQAQQNSPHLASGAWSGFHDRNRLEQTVPLA